MAFKDYLGAFLLGASAFLLPFGKAKAEDKEVKVVFQDKGTRGIPIIGKPDLEGIVNASAWTENDKINISIRTNNCYIEEHTRIFLGLQIDADPTQIKQIATAQTKEGNKTIDVSSSKTLKNIEGLVGKGVVRIADVSFLSDIIDAVNYVQGKEDRNIERQMRKEHLLLLRELPLHTKFVLNPITGIDYEITIDREQTETPQVIAEISLRDEYKRDAKTDKIWLKCDKRATKQSIPNNIEKYLLREFSFIPEKIICPEEISKITGHPVKSSYFARCSYKEKGDSLRVYITIWNLEEGSMLKEMKISTEAKNRIREILEVPEKFGCGRMIRDGNNEILYMIDKEEEDLSPGLKRKYEELSNYFIDRGKKEMTTMTRAIIEQVIASALRQYAAAQSSYYKGDYDRDGVKEFASDIDKLYAIQNQKLELISRAIAEADDDSEFAKNTDLIFGKPFNEYLFHDLRGRVVNGKSIDFKLDAKNEKDYTDDFAILAYPAKYSDIKKKFVIDSNFEIWEKDEGDNKPFDYFPDVKNPRSGWKLVDD